MSKYQQKAPVVEAAQWDGTLEGARVIRELLANAGHRVEWSVITDMTYPGSQTVIEFEKHFVLGDEIRMRPDMWLVSSHGTLDIMDPEVFKQTYEAIEE